MTILGLLKLKQNKMCVFLNVTKSISVYLKLKSRMFYLGHSTLEGILKDFNELVTPKRESSRGGASKLGLEAYLVP